MNNHDLFFAQGYYTARERLFQMELEALSVSGNFSRYIGPAGLSSDISARLQQIPQRAYSLDQLYKREYPQYYAYLKDYANGVNAYINQTINSPPLCFEIYGFSPV
ncbi:MAG: penicillin acylase family protein, partial [Candidatus Thermoplasmatota archaeon]|nr:penicillin acylase family protein [Candidatus Thermoplasmatota archaeon]